MISQDKALEILYKYSRDFVEMANVPYIEEPNYHLGVMLNAFTSVIHKLLMNLCHFVITLVCVCVVVTSYDLAGLYEDSYRLHEDWNCND